MGQIIPLNAEAEARQKTTRKISYQEFLEWYKDSHAEWVDGEIIMGQPPSYEHQADSDFLTVLLRMYIEAHELGVIISAPFQMRLADQKSAREPDLMFIAQENIGRITKNYLDGPADLAIEIISPESLGRDRGDKFAEYEAAGVREYWLIDPQRRQAEFYFLNDANQYELIFSGRKGVFHSKVLDGFYLRVEWLWQKPLPKVADLLKELGVL